MLRFENKPSSRIMLKKKSYRCMSGKKILSREVWENNLTKTKSPIPPPQKSNGRFPIFITLDTDCLYEKKISSNEIGLRAINERFDEIFRCSL